MPEKMFNIFRGTSKNDALWVDAVGGFEQAVQRMFELSITEPGPYFIFDLDKRSIVSRVHSDPSPDGTSPRSN